MRAPEAPWRAGASAGLEVKGVVEGAVACEEDGGAGRVEEGCGGGEGGYMHGLEVGVGVAIDLRGAVRLVKRYQGTSSLH